MAQKSTICKAALFVSDIDRGYYREHALTIARHPSETDERMMVRLLAFALHADDALQFGTVDPGSKGRRVAWKTPFGSRRARHSRRRNRRFGIV